MRPREPRPMTRRDFVKYTTVGAGALALPLGLREALDRRGLAVRQAGGSGGSITSPAVAHFQVPLPRPSVLTPKSSDATTDFYEVTMREGRQEILPGLTTAIWGYDGIYPGPTIEARRGRKAIVKQINALPEPMSIHFHGGVNAPEHDGYAEDITIRGQTLPTLIQPGASWTYEYRNEQPAAGNWYHDHAIHLTAEHVYKGLAGFYLLRDDEEASFNLPQDEFEVPLVLQDRIFDSDGTLVYENSNHSGVRGDVQLVNGAPWPRLQVAARKYRLRFLNGANWRRYDLELDNGRPLTQIGTDSGFLMAPADHRMIRLFQGERADVVIDFSGLAVGTTVKLLNKSKEVRGTPMEEVMLFEVVRGASDDSQVPATLTHFEVLSAADATPGLPVRDLHFDRRNGFFSVNGVIWDKNVFVAEPRLGTTEIWRFTNKSAGWFHPIHIHLTNFQILYRKSNGGRPHPWELGRKDVVALGEGEVVEVIVRWDPEEFLNFTGPYMIHCHNIDHEDHDMMAQMNLLPPA